MANRYCESPIGKKFGRLTVAERYGARKDGLGIYYICVCDCGKTKIALGTKLRTGAIRSCGCAKGRPAVHKEGSVYNGKRLIGCENGVYTMRCELCGKTSRIRNSPKNAPACVCRKALKTYNALSDDDAARIENLLLQGGNMSEVANMTGASYHTIRRYIKERGLPYSPKHRMPPAVTAEELARQGLRLSDIAARYGVSIGAVSRFLKRHGIKYRPSDCRPGRPKKYPDVVIGRKFGMLRVLGLERIGTGGSRTAVLRCECDCGNLTSVKAYALLYGGKTHCGCRRKNKKKERAHD